MDWVNLVLLVVKPRSGRGLGRGGFSLVGFVAVPNKKKVEQLHPRSFTASLLPKNDGWKITFFFGMAYFQGLC